MDQARLLERIAQLPSLSTSVTRIATLLTNEDATVADFEEILKYDPALTGNLLRIANSALYSPRQPLESVGQAVTWLGRRRLLDVVAGASFQAVLPARLPGYDMEATAFWQHSIAVAVLSQTLGDRLGLPEPELIFPAGLLHDLGKLAMASFLDEELEELLRALSKEGADIVDAEREAVGHDHAEVGGMLSEHWRLPERVVWAARWHHRPAEAPEDVDARLVGLVHLADGLAVSLGFGADVGQLARRIDPGVASALQVAPRVLEQVACDAVAVIQEQGRMTRPEDQR